ncbi:MAG: hypothetical protein WCB27_19455 [Thermoguttaceae bacterium]
MGQLLGSTPRAKGGQPHQKRSKSTSKHKAPVEQTLSELGISKKESSQAQMLADIPRPVFDAVKSGEKAIADVIRRKNEMP